MSKENDKELEPFKPKIKNSLEEDQERDRLENMRRWREEHTETPEQHARRMEALTDVRNCLFCYVMIFGLLMMVWAILVLPLLESRSGLDHG